MIRFDKLGQYGRLGNQLWQIASTLGIAASRNDTASFPPWAYQDIFSVPDSYFSLHMEGTNPGTFVTWMDSRARDYLQDYSLWKGIAPTIREYLKPSDLALAVLAEDRFKPFFDLPRPLVSVHVRRGDNATAHLRGEEGHHPLRPLSYYRDALALLPEDGSIVVFSDDLPWCKDHCCDLLGDHGDRDVWFFDGGPARPKEHEPEYKTAPVLDWIDLVGMTMCDYHIISNSSYSWWGAWLANSRKKIYPWPFMGPKLNYIDCSLMFNEDWLRLTHV